jgi:1-acyl-sn-glycerol-3-phosphate acyltransferase
MLEPLKRPILGMLSLAVVALNTILCCMPLFVLSLLKLLIPIGGWRRVCGRVLNEIAQRWVGLNNLGLDLTKTIHWDVEGVDGLSPDAWYLLMANHQTMVDIVVLQKIFHRKIPMLKFFIKKELIWVPFLGLAWWALDFPFMKRTSATERDLATAREACEKFRSYPVTVMNFVEGTRFTEAKREKRNSPYRSLLKPKAGGIAVVLACMGRQIRSILDVTIVYPQGAPGLWTFLCTKSIEIKVRVKQLPVSDDLPGNSLEDMESRQRLNDWLNALWHEKDDEIDRLRPHQSPPVYPLNTWKSSRTAW